MLDERSFFVPRTGFISEPVTLISEIIQQSPALKLLEDHPVTSLERKDGFWDLNGDVRAKTVVHCTGTLPLPLLPTPPSPWFTSHRTRV
jgi:hypothetical protein